MTVGAIMVFLGLMLTTELVRDEEARSNRSRAVQWAAALFLTWHGSRLLFKRFG